ncbi:MAG: MarR family winged helix-turn-helix transcriptional regulator [Gemmatimonadota bacterium]
MTRTAPPQMSQQILLALRRIIRATDLHSRRLLRDYGVTGPQLMVLRAVEEHGERSSSALAREISVSLATVADIAARLESRGLVTRQRGFSDKRQVGVSLTEQGQRVLGAAPPPLQESFTRQLADLSEWEQTQMLSVLQRIVAMMEAEELPAGPIVTPANKYAPGV